MTPMTPEETVAQLLAMVRDGRAKYVTIKKPALAPRGDDCRHRGAEVRRVGCGTCRGRVEKKVFACTLFGECGMGVEGVRNCRDCGERSVWPIRFDETNLAPGRKGKRFNASIIDDGEGFIFAYRDGWKGSNLWTIRLDREFRPSGEPVKAEITMRASGYGREDPRLFRHKGQLHLGFIGVQGIGRIICTNQCFARLGDDLKVQDAWAPVMTNRRSWEKNWVFFEYADELFAVYLTHPRHVVVKVECGSVRVVHDEPNPFPWNGGEIRGGASPVLVGNEFWSFTHDRVDVAGHLVYRMGLYTFAAEPPFAPRRMLLEPIVTADRSTNPGNYCSVYFPAGAVRRGDDWIIAAGLHDRWAELRRFNHADLESRLCSA